MAVSPPARTQTAPPPISSPSLLVGSGSIKASTTMTVPTALMPMDTPTATHSSIDNRALTPIAMRDSRAGSIPTFASSIRRIWPLLLYALARALNQPFALVRTTGSFTLSM